MLKLTTSMLLAVVLPLSHILLHASCQGFIPAITITVYWRTHLFLLVTVHRLAQRLLPVGAYLALRLPNSKC